MNTWYGSLVNKALDKKAYLLIGVLILFVVSSIGIWRMGSEFLPATDSHQISMQVELPHELSASDAAAVIDQITAVLEGIEDIETIGVTSVGSMLGMPMSMGGSGSNSTRSICFLMNSAAYPADDCPADRDQLKVLTLISQSPIPVLISA